MILPDANLLLYAYDHSSPYHEKASAWWERIMNSPGPVILLPVVVFAFVRIATHPRVFADPLSASDAAEHVRSWLKRRQVRLIDMQSDDVSTSLNLLASIGTAANLTTDAQIAAVALRLRAEVHTADLDFARFPGVRFRNPLTEQAPLG